MTTGGINVAKLVSNIFRKYCNETTNRLGTYMLFLRFPSFDLHLHYRNHTEDHNIY